MLSRRHRIARTMFPPLRSMRAIRHSTLNVLWILAEVKGPRFAVVIPSRLKTTSVARHKIKRVIMGECEKWLTLLPERTTIIIMINDVRAKKALYLADITTAFNTLRTKP